MKSTNMLMEKLLTSRSQNLDSNISLDYCLILFAKLIDTKFFSDILQITFDIYIHN